MEAMISIGDKYSPAMTMTEQATADAYFEECVAHTMSFGRTRAEAEAVERGNLGYYAGYYDDATRARVERLFHCAHPFFGSLAVNGQPTVDEALSAGREAARHVAAVARESQTSDG